MEQEYKYNPKPEFEERMKQLLPDKEDYKKFSEIVHKSPENFIRCNTLKITPEELKKRLEKKWKIQQPFPSNPEIFIINSNLLPGELGKSDEHILGYYYVQELSSMLSIIALNPQENQIILDLCASPGSKTTQASSFMKNSGTIIANDKDLGRVSILASNLEKNGCSNTILTRMDGINLCDRLKGKMKFDKILVDAPCSGEGTLRSNPKTFLIWNIDVVRKLSSLQKRLLESAIPLLSQDGELVYSTCTHAPEEDEEVVNYVLEKFPELELVKPELPVKSREGITKWQDKKFQSQLKKSCRIYPHDNNTEGFFLAKFRFKEKSLGEK